MGNSCSEAFNTPNRPPVAEIHIRDFKKTFKFLKSPKNICFTHDPTIFRLRRRDKDDLYMLKRIIFPTEKELTLFINKLDKIILLDHDNLLKIYYYAVEKAQLKDYDHCYILNIVIENFEHTLQDEITWRAQSNQIFKETQIRNFLTSLVDVLEFLQLKDISIGSLKPSTIYIASDRRPKLLYLGKLPCPPHTDDQAHNIAQLRYMSPQVRAKFAEALFPEKMTPKTMPSGDSTPVLGNPYKSDVFSLGLIVLEMMSMKSIHGLNGNDCGNMRQYRVIQCDKEYEPWLRNMVELMLRENELGRPDFLDLKKLLLMEECMEFTKTQGMNKENQSGCANNFKGIIELKTMKNRSEFILPAKYFIEPSDYSEMSLMDTSQDGIEGSQENHKKTADSASDLSPTKASTLTEVNGKRNSSQVEEKALEREEKKEDEETIEEVLIEKEKQLIKLYTQKIKTIRKLGISLEERQLSKETFSILSEFIGSQNNLGELVIAMPNTKLGDSGLEMIADGIVRAHDVFRCYFDFRKTKIKDNGIKAFGKCLIDKPKLSQLGLNFSDNSISNQGCAEIARWFGDLGHLKSLALNIGGNKIGNEGIAAIGEKFEKLKEAESVMMFMHNCEIEGKDGLIVFFEGLNKLEKLKKINLDFASNLLEDEEIEVIERYLIESKVEEIRINLKDNCVSEGVRVSVRDKLVEKGNVNVIF